MPLASKRERHGDRGERDGLFRARQPRGRLRRVDADRIQLRLRPRLQLPRHLDDPQDQVALPLQHKQGDSSTDKNYQKTLL